MKRLSIFALCTVLASCQAVRQDEAPLFQTASTSALATQPSGLQGAEVAAALTRRYLDVRVNCGSPSMPAFLCRGVVLRSTVPSNAYSSWNPSPQSQNSGGVSFTFLSKDMKSKSLVFGQKNGFIFFPVLSRPTGTRQIEVLCAYPRDGATQLRVKPGCGAHPYAPGRSRQCRDIGVATAEQWMANWRQNDWNMCSFNVSDSMNNQAADSFYQSIRAHNLGNLFAGLYDYSELILATWPQNIPSELPIEAFYYLPGGLPGAQHDQKDFFAKTGGKVVPIIKLASPTSATGDATFTYVAVDQAIQ